VTVIRHFGATGRLGKGAKDILGRIDQGIDTGVISVISLMEIMYLAEKHRINITLNETIDIIGRSSNYTIAPLTAAIVKQAQEVYFDELHDRLILATAIHLNVPIISSDKRLTKLATVQVVWN